MFCQIGVFSSVNWWDLYERMFYVWDILFLFGAISRVFFSRESIV
jgi:hypothetical protein